MLSAYTSGALFWHRFFIMFFLEGALSVMYCYVGQEGYLFEKQRTQGVEYELNILQSTFD